MVRPYIWAQRSELALRYQLQRLLQFFLFTIFLLLELDSLGNEAELILLLCWTRLAGFHIVLVLVLFGFVRFLIGFLVGYFEASEALLLRSSIRRSCRVCLILVAKFLP